MMETELEALGTASYVTGLSVVALIVIHTPSAAAECYINNRVLNMALNKTTYASSPTKPSSLTVDGQRSEYNMMCMDTGVQENPWLVVDLHETMSVSTIVLTAIDTAYLATTPYQVLVGDTFDADTFDPLTSGYEPCVSRAVSMTEYEFKYIQCERTLLGRYILIYRQEVSNLRICEVEVYAEQEFQPEKWTCIKPELQRATGLLNLARGRGTSQSSTYGSRHSVKAVDGNDDPVSFGDSCAQTVGGSAHDVDNWWVVNLGENAAVTAVVITNRNYIGADWKLENYKILVGNVSGSSTPFVESDYEVVVDMCWAQSQGRHYYELQPPVSGNHVAFTMTGWIVLCEVEVYADNLHDVSFPGWTTRTDIPLPDQSFLHDNNDNTCLVFGSKYPSLRVNPFHIEVPWDPTARTGMAERTADYYCNQDFYVNITHTADVKTLVIIKGEVVEDVGHGSWTFQGKACTLIGVTENHDMVKTRYACYCEDKCEVVIQVRGTRDSNVQDSRVCTINVYD